MKKIFFTLLVLIFFQTNTYNIGLVYSDYSNRANIDSAKLLVSHVSKLKKQLIGFLNKYSITGDKLIDESIRKLGIMEKSLKAIKNKNIYGENASENISTIVKSLRKINDKLKPYLREYIKIRSREVSSYKLIFSTKVKPFIPKIKNLIVTLASKIKSKKILNNKDKDIIKLLTYINNNIDNLNSFELKTFATKDELKSYLIENIKSIKRNILHIRRIYK